MNTSVKTDELMPMTELQIAQVREFVDGLATKSQTYWDMVHIGDELSRELHITPELVILYADAVEDFLNNGIKMLKEWRKNWYNV
jgi:hypothetical protein